MTKKRKFPLLNVFLSSSLLLISCATNLSGQTPENIVPIKSKNTAISNTSALKDFKTQSILSETEFPVNTITTNTQAQANVAMEKDGGSFVICWATNHEADGRFNVYKRLFEVSSGVVDDTVEAVETKVNNDLGNYNYSNPTIAMKPNGKKYAIAWENHLASGIQARVFDTATGATVGSQLSPSATTYIYRSPDVTFNNDYLAITWSQSRQNYNPLNDDIYGRIAQVTDTLTPTVSFTGSASRVHADNAYTREERGPAVTTKNATGGTSSDFNTTWIRDNSVIEFNSSFNPYGTPSVITTNSGLPNIDSPPAGGSKDDNYAVVWANNTTSDIYAKRFDGTSTYASSTINVNTTGVQGYPDIAMNDNYMLVVWHGPGDSTDIFARLYEVSSGSFGNPLTSEFQVNTDDTTGYQEVPKVEMDENGNAIIIWYSVEDGSPEVKAKYYTLADLLNKP
jgi:hypothetical protein